ncbi:MAG: hypothetical protein WCF84_17290 [Anaerolineae bacterium]
MSGLAIVPGYAVWKKEPDRVASRELHFGTFWKMHGASWRVSWLADTGELYATELTRADRFVVLGHFETSREINGRMRSWFAGDDLAALMQSLTP